MTSLMIGRAEMKWVEGKYTNEDRRYNDTSYKCSKCGCVMPYKTNFCPNCGEKNEEEHK